MGTFNLQSNVGGGSGGSSFLPVVKFNSQAGLVFRVDREDTGAGWVTAEEDITKNFRAVFDLENLEHGWISFVPGRAPDFKLTKFHEAVSARPQEKSEKGQYLYQFGMRFLVKLDKECANGRPAIREIAATALVFLEGLERLYDEYTAGKAANLGMLPVVKLERMEPVKSGNPPNTRLNFKPHFQIEKWAPRGDLVWTPKGGGVPAETNGGSSFTNRPPATGSTRVEPPKTVYTDAVKAEADADDFG